MSFWKPGRWFPELFLSWLLVFPIEIVTLFDSKYFTKTIVFMKEEGVNCVLTFKFIPD